jgi:2-iminobutanoate/2-iminopropanoate deaminase
VVKTTVYLTDIGDFSAMNQAYEERLGATLPARTTIAAAALPKGARVEIECIALGRDF